MTDEDDRVTVRRDYEAQGENSSLQVSTNRTAGKVPLNPLETMQTLRHVVVSIYPQQEDNIKILDDAAGIKVDPYWPSLVAKLLHNVIVYDLINNIGTAPDAGGGRWWRWQCRGRRRWR